MNKSLQLKIGSIGTLLQKSGRLLPSLLCLTLFVLFSTQSFATILTAAPRAAAISGKVTDDAGTALPVDPVIDADPWGVKAHKDASAAGS